ncbi:MAG TPA: hypothetical protein VGR15_02565 [Bacteroidota bacterium]|jgi:uncharacterized protein YoxC|nr:hypothetical protein [Bacteroidota bacterium]
MKTHHFITAALCMLIWAGCNNGELEQQNADLQNKNNQLTQDMAMRDQYVDSVTQAITDVYNSLESVRLKEGTVLRETTEMEAKKRLTSQEVRQKLLEQVSLIDSTLKQDRHRIADLQSKLQSSKSQYAGLKNMVASLKQTIEAREATIAQLEEKITGLIAEVNTKTQIINQRDSLIAQQHGEINRAYYIVGKRRELEDKGIIRKQGGFLWGLLGSTTVLSNGFDANSFNAIDKFRTTTIDVEGTIDEIIPKRNETFYTATAPGKNQTTLSIAEPNSFWQDKYLVIITN